MTLATVDGRVHADFVDPDDHAGTPFEAYWDDEAWERREATLHERDGTYYLHVVVRKDAEPVPEGTPENGVVLGVDLNVDGHIAVTSTGAHLTTSHCPNYVTRRRDGM